MNNQILGDTREVSNTLFGSQGVLDTQEQYKRSVKNRAYDNEGLKYLGTATLNATSSSMQITRTDLNINNGDAGHFDRDNRQAMMLIHRRVRHTTTTAVNLVLSAANASNTAINDTDNHYAKAYIRGRANSTGVTRVSEDSSRYYSSLTDNVFTTNNANHTLAGYFDITTLGEQHRNISVGFHFVHFGTYLENTLGSFNFDHLDDNSDDLPAYLNFAAYTGNNAYKKGDYYGYPEPHAIIMD